MKTKILAIAALVVALSLFLLGSTVRADHQAVHTVDSMYAAINEGSLDDAAASFAEDASFQSAATGQAATGQAEIGEMLSTWRNGGSRQYEIVGARMSGDTVELVVDISDRGHVWGQETVSAVVEDGKIRKFEVTGFRLQLYRMTG